MGRLVYIYGSAYTLVMQGHTKWWTGGVATAVFVMKQISVIQMLSVKGNDVQLEREVHKPIF